MTGGIGDWIARQGGLGAVRLGPRPRPVPGATLVETIRQLSRDNGLFTGEVLLAGRPRKPASITCPFLNVYGTHDHVTPPDSVSPLAGLVGSARADTLALKAGHIGLLVGGSARKQTLPAVTDWLASVRAEASASTGQKQPASDTAAGTGRAAAAGR